jgi:uncharacterized protein (TIGR02147 family)
LEWLRAELARRQAGNAHYSLRSFARTLGIPSGRLSELLLHKRYLTPRLGRQIAERLKYPVRERTRFLAAIERQQAAVKRLRRVTSLEEKSDVYQPLSFDAFHAVADWPHFAILSLVKTSDFRSDPEWIARRLGLEAGEVRETIARLKRLGLLRETDGRLRRTRERLTNTQDISSTALKRSHRQSLEQVVRALDEVSLEDRDITSVTAAIDVSKIPLAKTLIKNFRRTLSDLLEDGERTEVYNLNISLVPVTRVRRGKR